MLASPGCLLLWEGLRVNLGWIWEAWKEISGKFLDHAGIGFILPKIARSQLSLSFHPISCYAIILIVVKFLHC